MSAGEVNESVHREATTIDMQVVGLEDNKPIGAKQAQAKRTQF